MKRHVNLLGILMMLWGALGILVGLSMLALAGGALAVLLDPLGSSVDFAARLTSTVFALIGGFALLWGGVHVWAGVLIRRFRPLGRVLGLGLALVNLIVLPPGTALGIYALWVLLSEEGRRVFEPAR